MSRTKGSVNKLKFKADEPEQPTKTTKEAKASSPNIESAASSAPIQDPEWAKTSVVDPVTGIHISQWRREQLKKRDA